MDRELVGSGNLNELTSSNTCLAQAAHSIEATSPIIKTFWNNFSHAEMYSHRWTNGELREAIRADHSWLHPDQDKAAHMKNGLLQSATPARSFAVYKKWMYWRPCGLELPKRRGVTAQAWPTRNEDREDYVVVKKKKIQPSESNDLVDDDYVWV
jgi:hypothetical protein